MPFHRWLPSAMVAPTPVSALLHAVAVVKAGVFTMLKVGVYVFGIDFLADTGASQWLMWLAAFSILAASIVAMTKDNLKARLAYSTISQLSYITLGMALATSMGAVGGGSSHCYSCFGKNYAVHVCRLNLCGDPKNQYQRHARPWSRHAHNFCSISDWQFKHHWLAPTWRFLEQMDVNHGGC